MKQTVTLEVENTAVMQLLKSMAEMSLIKLSLNESMDDDIIVAQINQVCKEVDTSLDPGLMAAQMEVIKDAVW